MADVLKTSVTNACRKKRQPKREASAARKTISSDTGTGNTEKTLMDSRHTADRHSPYFYLCLCAGLEVGMG